MLLFPSHAVRTMHMYNALEELNLVFFKEVFKVIWFNNVLQT